MSYIVGHIIGQCLQNQSVLYIIYLYINIHGNIFILNYKVKCGSVTDFKIWMIFIFCSFY